MRTLSSAIVTLGLTFIFIALLTIVPALLPGRGGEALLTLLAGAAVLVAKAAWMVALAYIGARLALRHERRTSS